MHFTCLKYPEAAMLICCRISHLPATTMKFSTTLTLLASTAQFIAFSHAANCWSGPKWEYESSTYSDAWAVRAALCSQSSSQSCRTIGISQICEFTSGDVRGGYRAASQSEAMSVCYVRSFFTPCCRYMNCVDFGSSPGCLQWYHQSVYIFESTWRILYLQWYVVFHSTRHHRRVEQLDVMPEAAMQRWRVREGEFCHVRLH